MAIINFGPKSIFNFRANFVLFNSEPKSFLINFVTQINFQFRNKTGFYQLQNKNMSYQFLNKICSFQFRTKLGYKFSKKIDSYQSLNKSRFPLYESNSVVIILETRLVVISVGGAKSNLINFGLKSVVLIF